MPTATLLTAASAAPTIHVPHVDYLSILPMLFMVGGGLLLMVVSSLFRKILGVGTGTVVAAIALEKSPPRPPGTLEEVHLAEEALSAASEPFPH